MSTKSKKSEARAKSAPARKSSPASRAGSKAEPLNRVVKSKETLLERLESFGLLDAGQLRVLAERLENLPGATLGEGLNRVAQWDAALSKGLDAVAAEADGTGAAAAQQAFLAWQEGATESPITAVGLTRVLDELRRVVPYTGATLYLRDPESRSVRAFVSVGFEVDLISRVRFEEGVGFSAWVAARRKPVLYGSLHRNEAPHADQVRSFMAAPLVVAGECVGVLSLAHHNEGTFGPPTLRRLMQAAAVLAGPVQRLLAAGQIAAREIADRLTGLATGAYFRTRLEEEVVRCRELGYSTGLLLFRLNELPEYVAQFGEEFSRRSLAELGTTVREGLKATEIAGRIGEETFAVLIPGAGEARLRERGEEFVRAVERIGFPRRKRMTVRLGSACYPYDAEEAQDLLSFADKALRTANSGNPANAGSASLVAVS